MKAILKLTWDYETGCKALNRKEDLILRVERKLVAGERPRTSREEQVTDARTMGQLLLQQKKLPHLTMVTW